MTHRVDIKLADGWFDVCLGDEAACRAQMAAETEAGLYRIVERRTGRVAGHRMVEA